MEERGTMTSRSDVGVVIIGRNEGERLRTCIASVKAAAGSVVYVDSGSTDGSVAIAQGFRVDVVDLDVSIPFTAARARNAGAARLLRMNPEVAFIQFVDGDCELHVDWLRLAAEYLQRNPAVGVVSGRLRERHPEKSIYNRLCDMEWNTRIGEATEFGGNAMVRGELFQTLGGFRETLIAGEEPEMAIRILRRGARIVRLDHEMGLHDAAMTRFRQWWKRTVRSGHAIAERAHLHGRGPERQGIRERRSTVVWGLLVPLITVVLSIAASPWFVLLLLGYCVLGARVYRHRRRRHGDGAAMARQYAFFCVLAKFPQLLGVIAFYRNRLLGRRSKLIEYKSPPAISSGNPSAAAAGNTL